MDNQKARPEETGLLRWLGYDLALAQDLPATAIMNCQMFFGRRQCGKSNFAASLARAANPALDQEGKS